MKLGKGEFWHQSFIMYRNMAMLAKGKCVIPSKPCVWPTGHSCIEQRISTSRNLIGYPRRKFGAGSADSTYHMHKLVIKRQETGVYFKLHIKGKKKGKQHLLCRLRTKGIQKFFCSTLFWGQGWKRCWEGQMTRPTNSKWHNRLTPANLNPLVNIASRFARTDSGSCWSINRGWRWDLRTI